MRKLFYTLAIVCASVMMWSQANDEQTAAAENLEQTEETTTLDPYSDGYWKADRLGGRVPRVYGDLESRGRRAGQHGAKRGDSTGSIYGQLRPGTATKDTRAYDELQPGIYDGLAVRQSCPDCPPVRPGDGRPTKEGSLPSLATIVIDNDDEASPVTVSQLGWIPPKTGKPQHTCECKGDCHCPPRVCEAGSCKHNYVAVFASKSCIHCKKMWPVIEQLRKEGYLVFYLEVEVHPEIVKQFGLRLYPTTIVFDKGKRIARFNGVTSAEAIKKYAKTRKDQGLLTKKDTP